MKTITAQTGQTVFDIALQEMGSIEGVFEILAANAFLRPDMDIPSGTVVLVPDTVINASVVDYYSRNSIHPSSGLGEDITIDSADMIQIKQVVAYDLSDGDKEFDGVRLANLGDELSVQINYKDLAGDVGVYVEQSLDGLAFSPISGATFQLAETVTTHTFNVAGLVTNFVRLRLDVATTATGIIDEIFWRV